MFGLFTEMHQRAYAKADERFRVLLSIRGRKWKCGPWRWST